ncbi:hypothetical protein ACFS25_26585 [Spirosoma flavum]|uniref:TMF family protein n=2 Tax=Spirosoma flavum TaxID=2048557 RepID=A0ABW6ASH4_9BACT
MGIPNNNTSGSFNTTYGFIDNTGGATDFPPYTTGTGNTFMGANTGNYNTGSNNTAVGYDTGGWVISGSQNVFVGSGVSANWTYLQPRSSIGNSILGFQAGYKNQADYNVFMGWQSGFSNTTGIHNVFVGASTGYANTGGDNAFLGYQAGKVNTTGTDNTFLGSQAGWNNTEGSLNSFIGSYTGQANTTGRLNAFLGYATGSSNTTGGVNTFIGAFAGNANTTGKQNSFLGYSAGLTTTTGSNNTFVGYQAGQNVTTGSNNIIIGPFSGTAVTDGSDNVLMGYNSQAEDGLHNATAIGAGSRVAMSNALILGNQVNIGIGTSAPAARLEVVSASPDESGLRLTNLTSQSQPLQATDQFLTVNERGDVVKARYQLRINNPTEWSDKVFSPTYSLRPLSTLAAYVGQHGHLPGIPSAEEVAQKGLDLTKLNAMLLEKIEELTLYSIQLENKVNRLEDQQTEMNKLKRLVEQLLEKK